MTTKTLLLKSGLEIISEVEVLGKGTKAVSYRLTRPMQIMRIPVLQQTPQGIGVQGVIIHLFPLVVSGMAAPMFLNEDDLLAAPMETTKQAEGEYVQKTTGLVLS